MGWHWSIRSYRFQVYIPMTRVLHIALWTHHPQACHLSSLCICPPLPFTIPPALHVTVSFSFIFHMSEIMVFSFFWLISLSIIFSSSLRAVTNGSISSFLMAEWYSTVHMYHIFLIQSFIQGLFCCLHVLATMNNTALNLRVHYFLWINVFKFSRRYPEEGLLGHMVTLFLIFWATDILPYCFSQWLCQVTLLSPLQHLLPVLLVVAILTGMR